MSLLGMNQRVDTGKQIPGGVHVLGEPFGRSRADRIISPYGSLLNFDGGCAVCLVPATPLDVRVRVYSSYGGGGRRIVNASRGADDVTS